MTDFDPQAWLELGRANRDKLPDGVVLPATDYERYRDVLQRFYATSDSGCKSEPGALDDIDTATINGLLAVADEVIALRGGTGGWIDWAGGKRPVPPGTLVTYRLRSGSTITADRRAGGLEWSHIGGSSDIVAYKVVG